MQFLTLENFFMWCWWINVKNYSDYRNCIDIEEDERFSLEVFSICISETNEWLVMLISLEIPKYHFWSLEFFYLFWHIFNVTHLDLSQYWLRFIIRIVWSFASLLCVSINRDPNPWFISVNKNASKSNHRRHFIYSMLWSLQ